MLPYQLHLTSIAVKFKAGIIFWISYPATLILLLILQERQGEAMNKNQKQFIRPPYDSRFDQLNIINWNFPQKPTFQHGKYCIRFTLILGDGSTLNRQKGGFASAKEAMKYRDNLIVKLTQNQYMPYRFTLKEFYNYWLYYYIIDGCKYAYNTFKYYATPVKRFCEYFRPDTYMDSITTTDLKNFINKCETFSAYKAMMQMIQNSFQYAKNQQIIISNPAPLAIEICKKEKKITKPPTKKNAFTLNELMNLLLTARKMDYTFYLFLLLSASTGARVSETRAICFSKIDFQKKQLLIDCQLGRGYDNEGFDDNTLLSQKRTLKTLNSKRYVPLPDFIMDELHLARARSVSYTHLTLPTTPYV